MIGVPSPWGVMLTESTILQPSGIVTVLYSLVPEHAIPHPVRISCHCHSSCIYFPSLALPDMVRVNSAGVR